MPTRLVLNLIFLLQGSAFAASEGWTALGAHPGEYSTRLDSTLNHWPPIALKAMTDKDSELKLHCIRTPGSELLIGFIQTQVIDTSLEQVRKILDAYSDYPQLFDELKEAKVVEKKENSFVVFSEQSIPVPFVPNEKTEMVYRSHPLQVKGASVLGSWVYEYRLKKSSNLKFNDGMIVLETLPSKKVRYVEFDFYNADWGAAKVFVGTKGIWKESFTGLTQADLAVKSKSEKPNRASKDLKKESGWDAEAAAKKFDLKNCTEWEKSEWGKHD